MRTHGFCCKIMVLFCLSLRLGVSDLFTYKLNGYAFALFILSGRKVFVPLHCTCMKCVRLCIKAGTR